MQRTVLIVDPSYTCRWQLSQLIHLIEPGIHIYSVSNGLDALDIVNDILPDILISSICLSKMNGVTLLKKIFQKNPVSPPPKVILMQQFNRRHIREAIPDRQFLGYLDKPPLLKQLKELWPGEELYV